MGGVLESADRRRQLITLLLRYGGSVSVISFIGGIVWMCALAHPDFNGRNYLSENALMPGLVQTTFRAGSKSKPYSELEQMCRDSNAGKDLKEWLVDEMSDTGLDVSTQNFSIPSLSLSGGNVYGIYRVPRASGVESLIVSTSIQDYCANNKGGIALLLELSRFVRQQTYWAKDIVFLFTDARHLYGTAAWLEAHTGESNSNIRAQPLSLHAGSIQAAIHVTMATDRVSYFNLLFEGANGQLPNLDLINLVMRVAKDEGIPVKLRHQSSFYDTAGGELERHATRLQTLVRMMVTHASGYASAEHGLFFKYRIEAITLEGVYDTAMATRKRSYFDMDGVGRLVEGVLRSCNNLLERFHQSFFLYVLPETHRYISIGLYMPALGALLLPLVLTLLELWVRVFRLDVDQADTEHTDHTEVTFTSLGLQSIFLAHLIGFALHMALPLIVSANEHLRLSHGEFFVSLVVSLFSAPLLLHYSAKISAEAHWLRLKMIVVTNLAVILVLLSLVNFSLAFISAAALVFPAMIARANAGRWRMIVFTCSVLLSCPPVVMLIACAALNRAPLAHVSSADFMAVYRQAVKELYRALEFDVTHGAMDVWTRKIVMMLLLPIWAAIGMLGFARVELAS